VRRTRLIIIGVALTAGLAAAYLSNGMQTPMPPPVAAAIPEKIAADEVLVAARDLAVGARITARDLKWLSWPADGVSTGMIIRRSAPDSITASVGSVVREALIVNEPLRKEKLIKADSGFLAAILPSGKRAFAIGIDPQGSTSAGTLILPNDRVDVVQIFKDLRATKSSGTDVYTSQTLLENIRVLAIGPNIEEKNGARMMVGQTATLELDPIQVSTVALAARTGTLTLALRSVSDANAAEPSRHSEMRTVTIVRGDARQEYTVDQGDRDTNLAVKAPVQPSGHLTMR
jgi:pilus assembly protein CpaB